MRLKKQALKASQDFPSSPYGHPKGTARIGQQTSVDTTWLCVECHMSFFSKQRLEAHMTSVVHTEKTVSGKMVIVLSLQCTFPH